MSSNKNKNKFPPPPSLLLCQTATKDFLGLIDRSMRWLSGWRVSAHEQWTWARTITSASLSRQVRVLMTLNGRRVSQASASAAVDMNSVR